ncbi:hypothetical protein, partial [Bacillus sp. SIMBA_005]|uniref:hypothetical protein n=1 Tax=Bacillus sp. SIMBA_005 TaxID=3085754 RepID=UPI00397AF537
VGLNRCFYYGSSPCLSFGAYLRSERESQVISCNDLSAEQGSKQAPGFGVALKNDECMARNKINLSYRVSRCGA